MSNSKVYYDKAYLKIRQLDCNPIGIVTPKEIMADIERKLLGTKTYNNIDYKNTSSSIVVYSKTVDFIIERYNSIDEFWNYVSNNIIKQFHLEAVMVLHNANTPHIHLLLKYPNRVMLEDVAEAFGEYRYNKNAEKRPDTYSFDYLFESLYDSIESVRCEISQSGNSCHSYETSLILEVTPDLAKFILNREGQYANKQYEEYCLEN